MKTPITPFQNRLRRKSRWWRRRVASYNTKCPEGHGVSAFNELEYKDDRIHTKGNLNAAQIDLTEVFYAVLLFVAVFIAVFYIVAYACGHIFQDVLNDPTQQL